MVGKKARRRGGFTLIELLIVVAIIAILALIAVPNFIEAQTRSKVARVKADMRSLATALEAYFVDNNHYPYFEGYSFPRRYHEIVYHLIPLTTPVAYIGSVSFPDPFLRGDDTTYDDGIPRKHYNYRNHEFWSSGSAPLDAPVWVLNSLGPDGAPQKGLLTELSARGLLDPDPVVIYDPTNGTVSAGDLPRTGGETRFHPPVF